MQIRAISTLAAAFMATALLAGCESREAKAERFYQSALQLLAEGDEERALVELRNVFQYDGFHKAARQIYAETQLALGDVGEAYRHYLLIVEQYPDTADVRRTLAEIAIDQGNWEEAERHGQEAQRLSPEDPAAQAIGVALRYRDAALAGDDSLREEAAREAGILLAMNDDLHIARRIVIDWLSTGPNPLDALPEIDRALEQEPDSLELHMAKFRLLGFAEDIEGAGEQLRTMYGLFPENPNIQATLVRWYMLQGDLDGAEALLRELAGDATGPVEGHETVVQFLKAARSPDAARSELDRLIAANEGTANADLYRALRAGYDFEAGHQAEAVEDMEAILATAEPSDQTRRIKIALAKMLSSMGNAVGARSRVEEVLAEDATNTAALKMRAAWAIEDDQVSNAIVDLRTALSQSPQDVEVLTLMALAHERDGSPALASERLAAAVEASGAAPGPSLHYAEFLIRQGQARQAEAVVEEAWIANPVDVRLALQLATLRLDREDLRGAREIKAQLEAIGTEDALEGAKRLEVRLLHSQARTEDALAMLQAVATESGRAEDIAKTVQALVAEGKPEDARVFLSGEIAQRPDDVGLQMIDANLRATMGQVEEAEAVLRGLVEKDPASETPAVQLYALLMGNERPEEARAVLDAALEAQPSSRQLRWIKASELERTGDIAGAIAIYEAVYSENSSDLLAANNLASLLSQRAATPEDLERAYVIARRLSGTTHPAFQDTYGWIVSQRGKHDEAIAYLEPAAQALAEDPLVQFHLGMTYHAMNRLDDAKQALERALELGGDRPLAQLDTARRTLQEIEASAVAPTQQDAAEPEPDGTDAEPAEETAGDAEPSL